MKYLFLSAAFLCSLRLSAQTNTNPEELVRRVADNVIKTTSFKFVNNKTGQSLESTRGIDTSINVKAESKFNKWMYVNGVLTVGMLRISSTLSDTKYAAYSRKNFDFIFNNLDYFKKQYDAGTKGVEFAPVFRIGSLDDCGSMAAGLLDVYAFDQRKDYMDYLQRVGDYIINKQVKFPDGTLARNNPRKMTIWADDLYMSVPFLARMGRMTGDNKYFDDAIKQVLNFNKHLYDPNTGLYFHCWFSDVESNGVAHWLRCNGWIAMAQVELLNNLPGNHPKRNELIQLLTRQLIGMARYQDHDGLWHQVLDKPDSYLETSGTAMYVYAVARAVNQGWIPKTYKSIAMEGWKQLTQKIKPDGSVEDVCIGTGIADNISFYYNRPKVLNDFHVSGAVLLAATEMARLK